MSFTDIHQRVAADLSFADFIGQLSQWLDALDAVDNCDDEPCPWDITTTEWHFICDHTRVLYLMVVGP